MYNSVHSMPCLADMRVIFEACRQYHKNDEKAVAFFNKALEYITSPEIPILKVSDYETTGLTGGDFEGKWYGLVHSKGTSIDKSPGAGGSYGIGKNSHIAASSFRTVYYATATDEGHAFQGVTLLTTHRGPDGRKTQGNGYIGYHNEEQEEFCSIRNRNEIPKLFLRDQKGTDIYIPGYRGDDNWEDYLIEAALDNFWPAIIFKKVIFKIGSHTIDYNNVDRYIAQYSGRNGFTADRYFNVFKNGKLFETELYRIGKVKLYLIVEEEKRADPVAALRRNGMIIDYLRRFSSRKPFSGVFICDDEAGNIILQKMEPPRHDKWDPNRIDGGKKVISDIRDWIRQCIEKLMPLSDADSFELSDTAKYLPDESNEDEEQFDEQGEETKKDGFESRPSSVEVKPPVIVLKPKEMVKDDEGEEFTEGADTPGEGGEGNEGGSGTGNDKPQGGDGKNTGGDVNQAGGGEKKEAGNRKTAKLKFRSFYGHREGAYTVIIRSDQDYNGKISPVAIGDDSTYEDVVIVDAYRGTEKMEILEQGKSVQAVISPDKPDRLRLILNRKESIALRYIYENSR